MDVKRIVLSAQWKVIMSKPKRVSMRLKSEDGGPDLIAQVVLAADEHGDSVAYLEVNGKRIAKRYPRRHWIVLDPAYRVEGGDVSDDTITITQLPMH
jgi:hypothetical protein